MKSLVAASLGSGWIKLHPESLDDSRKHYTLQQMKPSLTPETMNNQMNVGFAWEEIQTGMVLVTSCENSQTHVGHNWNR